MVSEMIWMAKLVMLASDSDSDSSSSIVMMNVSGWVSGFYS